MHVSYLKHESTAAQALSHAQADFTDPDVSAQSALHYFLLHVSYLKHESTAAQAPSHAQADFIDPDVPAQSALHYF